MKLRAYLPDNLEKVVAVFRSNIPKYFGPGEEDGLRAFLADTRAVDYFVVEVNGQVVGSGGLALNDDKTVSLCWGMIREDHLGTGLGKYLTDYRIRAAEQRYAARPLVISTSQHTKGFYEKFGFRMTEQIADGFGPGIDICKMRRDP